MGRFIAYDDNNIDRKISSDINEIKNILVKRMLNIKALVLVGGFGRGEGVVMAEGSKIQAINDYDVVVITNSKISKLLLSVDLERGTRK